MSIMERLETTMLWLSLPSFGAGFALTAAAAYYGSIFMALLAIFFFSVGVLLYGIYRAPALFEGADSSDERRKREATHEFGFLIILLLVAMLFYGALAEVFSNTFSTTEMIMIAVLPLSFVPLGLAIVLFGFLKRPPESPPQPEGQEPKLEES